MSRFFTIFFAVLNSKNAIHAYPMYIVRPASLSTVGKTTSRLRVGFVESNKALTIIYYQGVDKSLARSGRKQAVPVKSVMGRGVD